MAEALGTLTNSGGGSQEAHPPPTSRAGTEEALVGTGGHPKAAQGKVDLRLGPAAPQHAHETAHNL